MDAETFNKVFERLTQASEAILIDKAKEYADGHDHLHNFKVAAKVQGTTPRKALAGMMVKHTVSVYDMVRSPTPFTLAQWDEKILDHINYLILLRAVLEEEADQAVRYESPDPQFTP